MALELQKTKQELEEKERENQKQARDIKELANSEKAVKSDLKEEVSEAAKKKKEL